MSSTGVKHGTNDSFYHYFSGSSFNLSIGFSTSPAESPVKEMLQNPPPTNLFENGTKSSNSCPLPTLKRRNCYYENPFPVADEFPDHKLADFGSKDLLPDETLHILVTGPSNCGKIRMVRALAKRNVHIPVSSGPRLAFKQTFAMVGLTVHLNVWYMKNPKASIGSLKDSKNFVIALVYDVNAQKTLSDVCNCIVDFRRHLGTKVPMILVGNDTNARDGTMHESSMSEWDISSHHDGQRVKDDYKLADFVECSGGTGQGVNDVFFRASAVALGDEILQNAMNHFRIPDGVKDPGCTFDN